MSIDWSKAPKDATHWEPDSPRIFGSWMKKEGDSWFWRDEIVGRWSPSRSISEQRMRTFEARPQETWDGQDIPPVGIAIEWLSSVHGWLGGRVVGHDGSVIVVSHNDGYTGCHPHEVRPIPTLSRSPPRSVVRTSSRWLTSSVKLGMGTLTF